MKSFHVAPPHKKPPAFENPSREHVSKDPVFVVTLLSLWERQSSVSPRPHLAHRGQGTSMGHWVPWPLILKLLLWHCLGCLFSSDCLFQFDRKNRLESNRWSRWSALCSRKTMQAKLVAHQGEGRTGRQAWSAFQGHSLPPPPPLPGTRGLAPSIINFSGISKKVSIS